MSQENPFESPQSSSSQPYGSQPNLDPHRATMVFVFGILGLLICFPLGIAAWVMGKGDLEAMRMGRMDLAGEGLTKAGYILGIITTVLVVLQFIVIALILLAGVA